MPQGNEDMVNWAWFNVSTNTGDSFLWVKRPNQQYQSTEGESTKENNPENTNKTQNTHTRNRNKYGQLKTAHFKPY